MIKVVINGTFSGFELPPHIAKKYKGDIFYDGDDVRTDPELIDWVEKHENETDLVVIELPNDTTDWTISDYDGAESIWACVSGKVYEYC